jgi:hypothetical protein
MKSPLIAVLVLAVLASGLLYPRYEQYQTDDETFQRIRLIPHDITDMAAAWQVDT